MKKLISAFAVLVLGTTLTFAQTSPAATSKTKQAPVATQNTTSSSAVKEATPSGNGKVTLTTNKKLKQKFTGTTRQTAVVPKKTTTATTPATPK